jgi:hypothetical protein
MSARICRRCSSSSSPPAAASWCRTCRRAGGGAERGREGLVGAQDTAWAALPRGPGSTGPLRPPPGTAAACPAQTPASSVRVPTGPPPHLLLVHVSKHAPVLGFVRVVEGHQLRGADHRQQLCGRRGAAGARREGPRGRAVNGCAARAARSPAPSLARQNMRATQGPRTSKGGLRELGLFGDRSAAARRDHRRRGRCGRRSVAAAAVRLAAAAEYAAAVSHVLQR